MNSRPALSNEHKCSRYSAEVEKQTAPRLRSPSNSILFAKEQSREYAQISASQFLTTSLFHQSARRREWTQAWSRVCAPHFRGGRFGHSALTTARSSSRKGHLSMQSGCLNRGHNRTRVSIWPNTPAEMDELLTFLPPFFLKSFLELLQVDNYSVPICNSGASSYESGLVLTALWLRHRQRSANALKRGRSRSYSGVV